MKALSVGLIKGNIDEVDQKVQMTWVQPRVLDLQQVSPRPLKSLDRIRSPRRVSSPVCLLFQIKGMKERLDFWCGDVKNMAMLVEQQAHDILT